jgi:GxxExxY protein
MPINLLHQVEPLNQVEFGKLAYDVVADVLAIRGELGRFFDEKHYKKALFCRRTDVALEFPVVVSYGTFEKSYFLDALIAAGGVFEFKSAESLTARHKAQLLNYLMLTELRQGC